MAMSSTYYRISLPDNSDPPLITPVSEAIQLLENEVHKNRNYIENTSDGILKQINDTKESIANINTTIGDSTSGMIRDIANCASASSTNATNIGTLQNNVSNLLSAITNHTNSITSLTARTRLFTDTEAVEGVGVVAAPISVIEGQYLASDGSWTTPHDTTYTPGNNVAIVDGVISATDTTYDNYEGSTESHDGTSGLVPTPTAGSDERYLSADGGWRELDFSKLTAKQISDLKAALGID